MPFTFSHAAAVLPFFKSRKVSISGLIVGSVAPDLVYFFNMNLDSKYSHTLKGVFTIDFLYAFLLLFVFHLIIKKVLIHNLPKFFQSRTQELLHTDWLFYFKRNVPVVLLSYVFGAFTHLVLDSLTHNNGYFVMRYDAYSKSFFGISLFMYVYRFVSIGGMLYMMYCFYKLPVVKQNFSKINVWYWLTTAIVTAAIFYWRWTKGMIEVAQVQIYLVVLLASFVCGLVVSGLLFGRSKAIA
ncbi:DUF4184 family protein [Flavobacterium sp. 7A]|uniref:DUF4184 family protein n=1 Tax=Flavobacterium sp. 7A TaxID=2940571 RepID=UPI002226ECF6|nr:DUF4184 family protein [Flavobacterium sp. 7A]MCW2118123.1 putative membrane protein [Flavobacterium sp. 7A]